MNETENRQNCRNKTHRGNFRVVTLFCPVCKRKNVIAVSPFHQYAAYQFITFSCCPGNAQLTNENGNGGMK